MIWATGSSRPAILSVIGFFVVGALLLTRVDVTEGQRVAQAVDRRLQEVCPGRQPYERHPLDG